LGLLKNILQQPVFKNHRLVCGTSLALQYGHRLSIDLDFFTSEFIEHEEILINIKSIGKVDVVSKSKYISCFFMNDVKVDFVSLPYHWIDDPIIEDSISLASINDIAAMKLSAITNRGSKKDFIDLQLIMKHLELKKMMSLYHQKYLDGMEMLVLRSLMYFDDADLQPDPVMLTEYDWNEVKAFILDQVKRYIGG